MPIILGRENGHTMALDEVGHRILVTELNQETGNDDLVMLVMLPETGLEIIPWSAPEVSQGAEIHAMPTPAPPAQQRRGWQRPA